MENGIDTATATTSEDQQRVTRSAGIVSIAVMASRLLGLVREKVIAYYFASLASVVMRSMRRFGFRT